MFPWCIVRPRELCMLLVARYDCEKVHPLRPALNKCAALSLQTISLKKADCGMAQKQHNIMKDLKPTSSLHVYGLSEGAWPLTKRIDCRIHFPRYWISKWRTITFPEQVRSSRWLQTIENGVACSRIRFITYAPRSILQKTHCSIDHDWVC